ncbi:unnamed protein product, partial [Caenorhabditis brenneri]
MSSLSHRWTTDPEYIELLTYIIGRTRNVESPMSIRRLATEFKGKGIATQSEKCLEQRIERVRKIIPSFEHVDTKTKVKMLFALSASVNAGFLKELEKDAFVEIDDKQRITHYKANDGSLEFRGDHSLSAKQKSAQRESKGSFRSFIISYFKTKDDADAVPKNQKEKEMGNLIKFITEKCDNVDSPLSITRLAKDFVEKIRTSMPSETVRSRIERYGLEIQSMEFLDTRSKVQQLFGLSATVNSDCLEKLRKNALVEVDEKNRIVYYKANDGSIELKGDHSQSAKTKTAILESKRSLRSLINSYFENKNNADAVPKYEEEQEMWNLIEWITEKCDNVNSPLSIRQLVKDFKNRFGISILLETVRARVRGYCREIQKVEFLDTQTSVKQLFSLSATVDSIYLKKLRKDAVVEVDDRNRITRYTANNDSLTLCGDHSCSAKKKLGWIERKKKNNADDDSDEYSSEEFGSEFDSDDENDPLDEAEDFTKPSNGANDFDKDTSAGNRSPTEMSFDDNFDFDSPTERSHISEETGMKEVIGKENDDSITKNASVKTRYGRLSKRRHLDAEFSYNLANCGSSGATMSTESATSKPAKQKKIAIEKEQASNSSSQQNFPRAEENPSDYHGPRIQRMEDYEYNPREDSLPESSPIDNRFEESELSSVDKQNTNIEAQNTDNRADVVAPEPEPVEETLTPQNNKNSTPPSKEKEVISQEVPIKVENEGPIIAEDHLEDVKPVTAHNPKIKLFEAMKSLILFLDIPSLSNLQSKFHQKIRKMKGSKEVLQNNELIPVLELLIARMANHSVIDISKSVKSVSLIQFLCYLKASILNSKMIGVEGLMNNISGLIEKSQNK